MHISKTFANSKTQSFIYTEYIKSEAYMITDYYNVMEMYVIKAEIKSNHYAEESKEIIPITSASLQGLSEISTKKSKSVIDHQLKNISDRNINLSSYFID